MAARDYARIAAHLPPAGTRLARMQAVVDALWDGLNTQGVSWVGFYLHQDGEELVLGPARNKPACSPIGLHGVCGRAFLTRQAQIVDDVQSLGVSYVACDPRDRSEVVLPLLDFGGQCWGVVDLDSHETGAFGPADVEGLGIVLKAAGLIS